jgi:hypothetical protein
MVKKVATRQLKQILDREVAIQSVRLNPYVLSATFRGVRIKDKDGESLASLDEFYANFQLLSFFGKPWVFKEIHLIQPFARAQINADRSINIADLQRKFASSEPQGKPSKPLRLHVTRLQVSGARLAFTDLTPSTPFHRIVGPLEVVLTEFHTDPSDNNPYSFSGTTDSGEQFSWKGHFYLAPLRSEGQLSLEGLAPAKYAPLYADLVRFEIKDGTIDTRLSYRVVLDASHYLAAVSNVTFSLKSLKIGTPQAPESLVELDELTVRRASADAMARTAEVGEVAITGARLALQRDREGTVNVLEAARPSEGITNTSGGILLLLQAATNALSLLLNSTNLWSATLQELNVTNATFTWEDHAPSRPARLRIDDLAVAARHLSNIPGSNMTATVSFRWNTNGSVAVQSTAQISPVSADVTLAWRDLELGSLDPYLEPFGNVVLLGGKAGLEGHVEVRTGTNGLPQIGFRGGTRLDGFEAVDGAQREELVKWKSLQISGAEVTLTPLAVTMKEVALIEPSVHAIRETNGLLNLLVALRLPTTNGPVAAEPVGPQPESRENRESGGLGRKLGSLLRGLLASNTNASGAALAPKFAIASVVLSNAQVRFNDRSLQPPVEASMQELNGTITGFSSEELKRADFHLSGKVVRTGPLDVTGKINPLSRSAPTEVKLTLRDVELNPASPYFGKYVGYRLNRGKLNLDVSYEVSERKLKAKNVLVLDQFTLGQKVVSPDATSLPVRLAVAVLQDRQGKIELDVPVEGNLDNPEFRFGKAIAHVILNIITKIATSPFAVLGAVFGGNGEEVSFQEFAPGSSQLQAANLKKLNTLAAGLRERPGLQLEIAGSFDPATDADALRRQKLERKLRGEKWGSLRPAEQRSVTPEQITLTSEERNERLLQAYASLTQGQLATNAPDKKAAAAPPPTNRPPPRPGGAPEKGAAALAPGVKSYSPTVVPNEVEAAVLRSITIGDGELRQLAQDRARRVLQALLESGKIESGRVSLAEGPDATLTNQTSRVYFQLR